MTEMDRHSEFRIPGMQSSSQPLILIIEDELPIRRILQASLSQNNYRFNEAATADEAFRVVQDPIPDLVILDLGLPDMDGQEVLSKLREWYSGPILILSAREQEVQKVAAFDRGADDYVTKPFGTAELLARVRSLLRRHQTGITMDEPIQTFGSVVVHLVNRTVERDGEPVHLTPLEYKLLTVFLKHPQKLLTHRYLLEHVWGPGHATELHYVRVFVANLRRKLELDPSRPIHFLTEPGIGYRFVP